MGSHMFFIQTYIQVVLLYIHSTLWLHLPPPRHSPAVWGSVVFCRSSWFCGAWFESRVSEETIKSLLVQSWTHLDSRISRAYMSHYWISIEWLEVEILISYADVSGVGHEGRDHLHLAFHVRLFGHVLQASQHRDIRLSETPVKWIETDEIKILSESDIPVLIERRPGKSRL